MSLTKYIIPIIIPNIVANDASLSDLFLDFLIKFDAKI